MGDSNPINCLCKEYMYCFHLPQLPSPTPPAIKSDNNADGNGADAANLASQYDACSHGKLTFVEASDRTGTDISIVNGATTVTVSTATTEGDGVMNNAIITELNTQFGVSNPTELADYVMHCLPPGTMGGIAYAYMGGTLSVYSDTWCTFLSAQMHEVGHNLGFHHSNHEGDTYGDQSGMLGYSYRDDDGPLMCFNGAKSWQSGWYEDRHATFALAQGTWSGNLIGQVDYTNANSNDPILLQLDTADNAEYYVQFNRKDGANSGTLEGGDQVMITKERSSGTSPQSELLAKIGAGGSYQIPNYDGSGRPLNLEVTVIDLNTNPPYASISIATGTSCSTSTECDDGLYCNGAEYCGGDGYCRDGSSPCLSTQSCSEALDGFCGECQSVTLELTTDDYPWETSWTVTDPNSVVVDFRMEGTYTTTNTVQTPVVIGGNVPCLSHGVHTFTITENYGDGICCTYGSGSYKLMDHNGAVLHEGGEFTSSESKTFSILVPSPPIFTPTASPVTASPVSQAPVSQAPVSAAPISQAPMTAAPVTSAPVTASPVSSSPTASPVTASPVSQAPIISQAPVSSSPTASPVTQAPMTSSPTASPITQAPVTSSPTPSPTTQAPTASPVTSAPVTSSPTASCGNGICEANDGGCSPEKVSFCPSDCIYGGSPGGTPVCGNSICEAGDGENYDTCPGDCPHSGGSPKSRYFCGIDGCDNPKCNSNGLACTTEPSQDTRFCCGDGTCSPGEDEVNCPLDCEGATSAPVASPTAAPIGPPTAAPVFQPTGACLGGGSSCGSDSDCCSNNCKGNGLCK